MCLNARNSRVKSETIKISFLVSIQDSGPAFTVTTQKAWRVRSNFESILASVWLWGLVHKEFDPSYQIVNVSCYRKGLQHMGERVRRTRPVRWRNVDWFWQTTIVRWSSVLCQWCNFWPLEKWLWPYILVTSMIRPIAIYYFFRESHCTYESIASRIPLKLPTVLYAKVVCNVRTRDTRRFE